MKGKKRKGSTLPMVIITIVLLTAMIGIIASIIDTGQIQTQRMYSYLNAKYVATSGSQLALGAYFGEKETGSSLYTEFEKRAEGKTKSTNKVTSTHQFQFGKAEVEISGQFVGANSGSENYYVTIKSKSQLAGSQEYYVHTVVFNWATSGIRTEKGGLETAKK